MKEKFNLKKCLALFLAFVMVATNLGGSISAKAETAEEPIEIDLMDTNKFSIRAAKPEEVTRDGASAIKVKPDGTTTGSLRFDGHTVRDYKVDPTVYKYAAVDYYYDVDADNATKADHMALLFMEDGKPQQNVAQGGVVAGKWARLIFDFSSYDSYETLCSMYEHNKEGYSHIYFFMFGGNTSNWAGTTAQGTMYINNLTFYTSNPGEPKVDNISFGEKSLTIFPGGSLDIPAVTVTGENAPHAAHALALSGQTSEETYISDGKLYIGADETSETITITAKSLLDETKTDTCTITVKEPVQRVTVDLKNEGGYEPGQTTAEDITQDGVNAIKVTPKGSAGKSSRFNYWLLKNHRLQATEYKYVAVDYYYDVTGVEDTAKISNNMTIMFANYTGGKSATHDVNGTGIVTGKWARVIFDLTGDTHTALNSVYDNTNGEYNQIYVYPYGKNDNTAVGTVYINNLSFYAADPGQPDVTGISFSRDSFTSDLDSNHTVPIVKVEGNNYPIAAHTLELSGQMSENTYISEGKIYVGADETSKRLTITAKSLIDETQTATCTIKVEGSAERVPLSLKNVDTNGYSIRAASAEDTTYGGVNVVKVVPDGTTTGSLRFDYPDIKTRNLGVKTYQYVAVDYYYDVTGVEDTASISDKMSILFANYTNNQNKTLPVDSTEIVTGKWARVIFDLTGDTNDKLSTMYSDTDGQYNHIYFFLYGYDNATVNGTNAKGTMYINNVTFYKENPGQPEITDVSFSKSSLAGFYGNILDIPTVTVTGKNDPILDYKLELSGNQKDSTYISDGKLHIGEDETSKTLKITATSVFDATKKATCTISVKEEEIAAYVTVDLKNETGYGMRAASIEDTIYNGVNAIKVTPDGKTSQTVRFDYWCVKNYHLKASKYKYAAVDYYYDVDANKDGVSEKMDLWFHYADGQYVKVPSTKIVTNQWARVIFDFSDLELDKIYASNNGEFDHVFFFLYGGDGKNLGTSAVGTMYINNLTFYTSEPGQPEITGISFNENNITCVLGHYCRIPNISATGKNNPIVACDMKLSGHKSKNTYIKDGKLYLGLDETSRNIKIIASAVSDATMTATCTVTVKESTLPSGDPKYMAKMIGTYIDANGVTKQWKEVYQNIFDIEVGKTYEFSFNYYVPGEGSVQARIMGEGWKVLERAISESGEVGKLTVTYTAKAEDKWLAPLISKDTEGIAYVWNCCFYKVGTKANLLENADFAEEGGSWVNWMIGGVKRKDKADSQAATAAVGHEIVKFNKKLFEAAPGNASAFNSAINPNAYFDFADSGKYKALDTWLVKATVENNVPEEPVKQEEPTSSKVDAGKLALGIGSTVMLAAVAVVIVVVKKKSKKQEQ